MPTWIDCSGDEGFKFGHSLNPLSSHHGSSRFYVVAAVTSEAFLASTNRIRELHDQLGMAEGDEFHFSEDNRHLRCAFLAMLDCYQFDLHALVVKKEVIYSPPLRNNGTWFRQFFCKELLRAGRLPLSRALVYIDPPDTRTTVQDEMRKYLMREVNATEDKISSVVFVPSHNDPMMQAADMCAGAIRFCYENKKPEFRKLIENRIRNEWFFG